MSLLRFLKFGRAFNQGGARMGHYRLPRHGGLPKFNVNQKPEFKSTVVRAASEGVVARGVNSLNKDVALAAPAPRAERRSLTRREPGGQHERAGSETGAPIRAGEGRVETAGRNEGTDQRSVPRVTAQKSVARADGKSLSHDTVRLPSSARPVPRQQAADKARARKQREWGWARKLNPFAGRPERDQAALVEPVQREFSLDSVKPVRNDLTDSDLELVSVVRPEAQKPEAEKAKSGTGAAGEPETLWGRLSEKLFDAGRTP